MDGLHEDERMFASYPMPNMVISAATDADPALVLAIARQESAFKAEAKSPAGAKGMMQVMPTTATHVIKHPQFASLESDVIAAYGQVDLMQPSTNVKVGASYVDMLAKKPFIGGNLVKTLAAYNAGPGNVAAWNKTAKNITDPLLYIESIPFAETRNYVVQVLAHYAIYEGLMGENDTVITSLKQGMFPEYKS
jgi:soluble lytic murein transglycosylase-like protein